MEGAANDKAPAETARAQYQAVVAARNTEIIIRWQSNTAFLVANSVLFAFLAQIYKEHYRLVILTAAGGILICLLWAWLNQIRKKTITYWGEAVRELEEKHLEGAIAIFHGTKFKNNLKTPGDRTHFIISAIANGMGGAWTILLTQKIFPNLCIFRIF